MGREGDRGMRGFIFAAAFAAAVAVSAADPAIAFSAWSIQPTLNPTGVSESALEDVSCPALTICIAVGAVNGISGPGGPLAEQWNGSTWAIQPNPQGQYLTGVSCPSTTKCTAVGPRAYRWNGTAWAIQPTPSEGNSNVLRDVSCTAAKACTAVGSYHVYQQGGPGYTYTLAERWNGTAWQIQSTPNPNKFDNSFDAVSCTTATACTAVGNSITATLAERWNGTAWTIQSTPKPAGPYTNLSGVSCPSSTDCTAVGEYEVFDGTTYDYRPLAEQWNGSAWTVQVTPMPSGATNTVLERVACTSANSCTAVGWYTGGTLVEHWNGTAWKIRPTPNPTGATSSVLSGVSCTTATACTAVGAYNNTAGNQRTLAERHSG
jgi:hypothetical protein